MPLPALSRPFRHAALAVAAVALTGAVLPGVSAAAAPAAPGPAPAEKCSADAVCAWPSPDFAGEITEIGELKSEGCHPLPRAARSAMNDTGLRAVLYSGADCTGEVVTEIAPGGKSPSFTKASSVRLAPPATTPRVRGAAPEDPEEVAKADDTEDVQEADDLDAEESDEDAEEDEAEDADEDEGDTSATRPNGTPRGADE